MPLRSPRLKSGLWLPVAAVLASLQTFLQEHLRSSLPPVSRLGVVGKGI